MEEKLSTEMFHLKSLVLSIIYLLNIIEEDFNKRKTMTTRISWDTYTYLSGQSAEALAMAQTSKEKKIDLFRERQISLARIKVSILRNGLIDSYGQDPPQERLLYVMVRIKNEVKGWRSQIRIFAQNYAFEHGQTTYMHLIANEIGCVDREESRVLRKKS